MNTNYFVSKMKEQKKKIDQMGPEEWLTSTLYFVQEYFGNDSIQSKRLKDMLLINEAADFATGSVISKFLKANFSKTALSLVMEFIQMANRQEQRTTRENFITSNYQDANAAPKDPPSAIVKYPLGLAAEAFLGLLLTILGGAFWLGCYFTNTKFDKDKNDLFEQTQSLKRDTAQLHQHIETLNNNTQADTVVIKASRDSLSLLKKQIESLCIRFLTKPDEF